MPITNAGAGRIARLHRVDRLDEEEHSITLHLISGVYSSVVFFKENWLIFSECGISEGATVSGPRLGARRIGHKIQQ